MITSNGENREIYAEPDENGAKADTDHAQPSKEKLAGCKRYETGEKKAKRHSQQRQPSAKPSEKNRTHEHDRAKQCRHDIEAHAQRNFGYKCRASGHENFERLAAVPTFGCGFAKLVYVSHQALAFKRADRRLIRHYETDSHRAIR